MVRIASSIAVAALIAAPAVAGSATRREYTQPITRELVEQEFRRSLDMADGLDAREPFLPLLFGAIRGISAAVRIGKGAARVAKAGHRAHRAKQHHDNRKKRKRDLEDVEEDLLEREYNKEVYDSLD